MNRVLNVVSLSASMVLLALSSPPLSQGHWDKPYIAIAAPFIALSVWSMFNEN
jgi:hypothetical protein